jgi:signal peptidase II
MSQGTGRPRWGIFLGLAATVVILDQATKAWLVSTLGPGERLSIIGDLLRLAHSQNSGALFGLFRDQAYLFALASIGVVAAIVWYHRSSGRNTLLSIALGLLLGGAIGNMIDRLRLGYVTDWVDIGLGDLRFYTFNVADASITCSILLLIVLAIWPTRPDATPTTGSAGGPADGAGGPAGRAEADA